MTRGASGKSGGGKRRNSSVANSTSALAIPSAAGGAGSLNAEPGMGGLQEEIAILRALIRQVGGLADEGHSLMDLLHILDSLSQATSRLGNLLKMARTLGQEDLAVLLEQALNEAVLAMQKEEGERK